MTRNSKQHAQSSPADFMANMVIGIPRRQNRMVIPCPTGVLGVICPYPEKKHTILTQTITYVKVATIFFCCLVNVS